MRRYPSGEQERGQGNRLEEVDREGLVLESTEILSSYQSDDYGEFNMNEVTGAYEGL